MEKKEKNQVVEMLSLIGQITITMLVPIIAMTFVGMQVGQMLDHKGLASVIGFILGCIVGFESVYKIVKKYLKNKKSPAELAREREQVENECSEKIK